MREPPLFNRAQRMSIYFGESDRWRGKPLSSALLEVLRDNGAAGATLIRGVAGFGAASRIHMASILRLSEDLPLILEVVDTPEKIRAMLDVIYPMVREGMITVEDLTVVRYTHRYLNPLPADRLVEEVMTREVHSLTPDTAVHAAWQLMLAQRIKALPVVDERRVVIGIVTDGDLLKRAGLQQRLAIAARMHPDLIQEEMQALESSQTQVAAVMTSPVLTAKMKEPLGLAAGRMVKNHLKRMPVVNLENQLVGMLSRLDILSLVASSRQHKLPSHVEAGVVRTVLDVMRAEIPTVKEDDDLQTVVDTLCENDSHRLIVVDRDDRPIGMISDSDVVTRIQPAEQRGVLQALRKLGKPPSMKMRADELMSPGVITVLPDLPVVDAAQKMLAEGRKWIVVVDADGRALGFVDREILLHSMAAYYHQD
jgi:CBS domain-containing protein